MTKAAANSAPTQKLMVAASLRRTRGFSSWVEVDRGWGRSEAEEAITQGIDGVESKAYRLLLLRELDRPLPNFLIQELELLAAGMRESWDNLDSRLGWEGSAWAMAAKPRP